MSTAIVAGPSACVCQSNDSASPTGTPLISLLAYVGSASYSSYADFKTAVLGLSQMSGKTIVFQCHAVSEETVEN